MVRTVTPFLNVSEKSLEEENCRPRLYCLLSELTLNKKLPGRGTIPRASTKRISGHHQPRSHLRLCPNQSLTMANLRLSPSANLLRNSRLFALPPAIARPKAERESPTATTLYPTHAAIETTPSSLSRGDWGLKRSLPRDPRTRRRKGGKMYGTSTPIIRIGDIDSIDHITDFESAADHAINLQKFQDMNLPLTRRTVYGYLPEGQLGLPHKSVFDPSVDHTDADSLSPSEGRWKFKGPRIAMQKEGEFQEYLEKSVKDRKRAFVRFLRKRFEARKSVHVATEATEVSAQDAFDGKKPDAGASNAEFEHYLRELRQDEDQLSSLIEYFFDLPTNSAIDPSAKLEYLQQPPKTHLSAGLSYLKSAAHITNDPVRGPQLESKPVQARVLSPAIRDNERAMLGVGGFAVEDGRRARFKSEEIKGIRTLDTDTPGGTKLWVHPRKVFMGHNGQIEMEPERASTKTLRAHGIEPPKTLAEVQEAAEADARDAERRIQAGRRHLNEEGNEELSSLVPSSAQSDVATETRGSGSKDAAKDLLDLMSLHAR